MPKRAVEQFEEIYRKDKMLDAVLAGHLKITGIAGHKGYCAITIEKSMMNSEIGFGRKVLNVFEDNGMFIGNCCRCW